MPNVYASSQTVSLEFGKESRVTMFLLTILLLLMIDLLISARHLKRNRPHEAKKLQFISLASILVLDGTSY